MMANDPFWCIVHSRFHFKIWDSSFIYFFHQMNISATNIQVFDESFPSIFNSFKLAADWIRLKLYNYYVSAVCIRSRCSLQFQILSYFVISRPFSINILWYSGNLSPKQWIITSHTSLSNHHLIKIKLKRTKTIEINEQRKTRTSSIRFKSKQL